jgi:hypothetical protein
MDGDRRISVSGNAQDGRRWAGFPVLEASVDRDIGRRASHGRRTANLKTGSQPAERVATSHAPHGIAREPVRAERNFYNPRAARTRS